MVRHFAEVRPEDPCTESDLVTALENIGRCKAVLRFEHLSEDLQALFSAIDSEKMFDIPKVNVTNDNYVARPEQYEAVEDVDFSDLSSDAVQALYNLTHLDARLYDHAANMAQHKRKDGLSSENIDIVRYALTRGEIVHPCKDHNFLTMLAHGWADIEEGTAWSIAPEAFLKFKIDAGTDIPARLEIEFNVCMVTNRKYCLVDVVYGRKSQKILFLQAGAVISAGAVLKVDADMICVTPSSARVKIDLENDCDEDHVHTVSFRLAAGTASPLMLRHNHDSRCLGVKLISLELM